MLCAFNLGVVNGNLEDTTKTGECQGRRLARFLRSVGWRDVPDDAGAREGAQARGWGAREDLAKDSPIKAKASPFGLRLCAMC